MTDSMTDNPLDDCYDRIWKRIRARYRIDIKNGIDYREKSTEPPRLLDLVEWH